MQARRVQAAVITNRAFEYGRCGAVKVADWLRAAYRGAVATIDDLLGSDTDTAARAAVGAVPDFVAEMDELAPAVAAGCGRSVL